MRLLSVKVDYVATISNYQVPLLEAFEVVDRSGRWSQISSRFGNTTPDQAEFPHSLSPTRIHALSPCPSPAELQVSQQPWRLTFIWARMPSVWENQILTGLAFFTP